MISSAGKVRKYVLLLAAIGAFSLSLYAAFVYIIAHANEEKLDDMIRSTQRVTLKLHLATSQAQAFKEILANGIALEDPDQLEDAKDIAEDFLNHMSEVIAADSNAEHRTQFQRITTDFRGLYPVMIKTAVLLLQDPAQAPMLTGAIDQENKQYKKLLENVRELTQAHLAESERVLGEVKKGMSNARSGGVTAAAFTMAMIVLVAVILARTAVQAILEGEKLKDEFLANTSHELRTPLHGILGLSEALIHDSKLNEQQRSYMAMIIASGKRLSHLINDILDFSKLKSSATLLELEPVSACEYADWVLRMSLPLIGNKRLQLKNEISPDLPPVMADADKLQQIFHNLLSNAIKFTEEGIVRLSAELQGDVVAIQVSDTGTGISNEHLGRIFDAFNQGDGSSAREHGGTGLGLSITRQLVALHGGRIYARARLGLHIHAAQGKLSRQKPPAPDQRHCQYGGNDSGTTRAP